MLRSGQTDRKRRRRSGDSSVLVDPVNVYTLWVPSAIELRLFGDSTIADIKVRKCRGPLLPYRLDALAILRCDGVQGTGNSRAVRRGWS